MSKFKFEIGDRVVSKPGRLGWEDIYVVVFNVKIAGKKFCGVLGPLRDEGDELLEGFISSAQKGVLYSTLLIAQKHLQIYREPVYVQMTREQYERVIMEMAGGPELPDDRLASVDLRDVEEIG